MRIQGVCLFLVLFLVAGGTLAGDRGASTSCSRCGMKLSAHPQSRMVITYSDGTSVGTCSLHCFVAEMRQMAEKMIMSLKVADYATERMIDARSAIWVVGGSQPGVMTKVGKWAFAKRGDAKDFVREHGGKVTVFAEALKSAEKEE